MKILTIIFILLFAFSATAQSKDAINICIYQNVSGRISDTSGNGISATVEITALYAIDPVFRRFVKSNQFGLYFVPNLISCENYQFRVIHKKYTFVPESMIVIPVKQSTDLNFWGYE